MLHNQFLMGVGKLQEMQNISGILMDVMFVWHLQNEITYLFSFGLEK